MDKLPIKHFRVEAPPAWVQYGAASGAEPVMLEPLGDRDGSYKVRLKRDQFDHSGSATGNGTFELELIAGNTLYGDVLSTEPALTPEGENSPLEITFNLQAR